MYLTNLKKFYFSAVLLLMQVYVFAQDSAYSSTTATSSTTIETEQWYMQKWVWIAGGIIILLILIALFSGGNKTKANTDRVTITKTVRTESDRT